VYTSKPRATSCCTGRIGGPEPTPAARLLGTWYLQGPQSAQSVPRSHSTCPFHTMLDEATPQTLAGTAKKLCGARCCGTFPPGVFSPQAAFRGKFVTLFPRSFPHFSPKNRQTNLGFNSISFPPPLCPPHLSLSLTHTHTHTHTHTQTEGGLSSRAAEVRLYSSRAEGHLLLIGHAAIVADQVARAGAGVLAHRHFHQLFHPRERRLAEELLRGQLHGSRKHPRARGLPCSRLLPSCCLPCSRLLPNCCLPCSCRLGCCLPCGSLLYCCLPCNCLPCCFLRCYCLPYGSAGCARRFLERLLRRCALRQRRCHKLLRYSSERALGLYRLQYGAWLHLYHHRRPRAAPYPKLTQFRSSPPDPPEREEGANPKKNRNTEKEYNENQRHGKSHKTEENRIAHCLANNILVRCSGRKPLEAFDWRNHRC
jgi:hypothetical protein